MPTFTRSPQESAVPVFLCCRIKPDAEDGFGRNLLFQSGAWGHSLTWFWQVQRDWPVMYPLF